MLTEDFEWRKVFALAACAVSIASLPETLGMSALGAVIACGKAAEEWWTD